MMVSSQVILEESLSAPIMDDSLAGYTVLG
jgi:hypothetical protein